MLQSRCREKKNVRVVLYLYAVRKRTLVVFYLLLDTIPQSSRISRFAFKYFCMSTSKQRPIIPDTGMHIPISNIRPKWLEAAAPAPDLHLYTSANLPSPRQTAPNRKTFAIASSALQIAADACVRCFTNHRRRAAGGTPKVTRPHKHTLEYGVLVEFSGSNFRLQGSVSSRTRVLLRCAAAADDSAVAALRLQFASAAPQQQFA